MSNESWPYPIIRREAAIYVSTSFNEIVTCRMPDGNERRLLMKRGGAPKPSFGHRGGVPYEAEVYKRVLAPLGLSTAKFFGDNSDGSVISLWIDYIEDSQRLNKSRRTFMPEAAAWIGTFHRLNEDRVNEFEDLVNRYDGPYFQGWADRTWKNAGELGGAWLPRLCRAFEGLAAELVSQPTTIIHGEYYPKNILVRKEMEIVPVDWESVAIGPGEIDLASLIEGWPEETRTACLAAYIKARWDGNCPEEFDRRFAAARMYFFFRWLGEPNFKKEDQSGLLEELRLIAESAGII